MRRPPTGERGDIVLGWLTKLTATLAVLGVLGFDALALGTTHLSAQDHAQTAARAAVTSFGDVRDVQKAYDAALAEVVAHGATIDAPTFSAAPNGSVTLTLRTQAPTLIVHRIPVVESWAAVSTTVTGRRPAL